MKERKIGLALDLASSVTASVAMTYFLIFALAIFPKISLAGIQDSKTDNIVGAFGIAFGTAIGVALGTIILSIIAIIGLVIALLSVVFWKGTRRETLSPESRGNGRFVLCTVFFALLLVFCVLSIFWIPSYLPAYLPVIILCSVSSVLGIVAIILLAVGRFRKTPPSPQSPAEPGSF